MSKARDIADLNVTILDSVEASATADQTNAEIRAAVEAATDSNVFTDADHSKLNSGVATVVGSETLTNKTLTSPDLNTPDIDGGTIDGATVGASSASTGAFTTLSASGDVNFDSGTLFVDASANKVGLGTVSPTGELHVKSASSNANFYLQRSVYDPWRLSAGAGYLAFLQDSSEKMRLSGGNLLVGKTSQATATIGAELGSSGYVSGSRDGNTAGFFNRTTSDGEVIRITKNGVAVGSIGVQSNDNLYIDATTNGGAGLMFWGSGGADPFITPREEGADADAKVGLGRSNLRFTDLYLSGEVIAGAGANNNPSITSHVDTDTGLFFGGGDILGFSTGGSERMRIDSSGNVGIGVTNVGAPLDIGSASPKIRLTDTGGGYSELRGNGGVMTLTADAGNNVANSAVTFETDGSERMRITSSGNLLVGGTADRGGRICVGGTSSTARILPQADNVGYIGQASFRWQALYAVNGTVQTSDEREKTEIKPTTLGLEFIKDLRPVSYKWIDGEQQDKGKDKREHQGLIAQQVAKAVEKHGIDKNAFGGLDIQKTDKYDDFHGMQYDQLIAPLIKAVQEQQATIESLTARIAALEE